MIRIAAILAVVLSIPSLAQAQCASGRCLVQNRSPELHVGNVIYFQYPTPAAAVIVRPRPVVYASPQSVPITPAPVAVSTDPYGFILWLNAYRGARGRPPIVYNAHLAALAMSNCSIGFGHHGPGGMAYGYPYARRENAGMGSGSAVWPMWTASPGHNDALLDPTITSVGIAERNGIWTYNAR